MTKKKIAIIIISIILTVILLVGLFMTYWILGDIPYKFDLEDYKNNSSLLFYDEFNSGETISDKWTVCQGNRRGGFWTKNNVFIDSDDTNDYLTIATTCEDGKFYMGAITTENTYVSKYGYYEAEMILPKNSGIWSAFWLMPIGGARVLFENGSHDASVAGAEIDIMEAPDYPKSKVQQAVHVGGYGDKHFQIPNLRWLLRDYKDLYDNWHTYGVYWNDEIYIFYIDGKVVWKTNFLANVSQVDEYMILSVEVDGTPDNLKSAWSSPLFGKVTDECNDWTLDETGHGVAEFKINYVRHYRSAEDTQKANK